LDFQLAFLLRFFCIRLFITFVFVITSFALSKDFSFELSICLFVLFVCWVELEDIQAVFRINYFIQSWWLVSDLVIFLDKIQLFFHSEVILVSVLPHLKEHLNHILRALVNICLVQDMPELVKDEESNWTTHFFQMLANFSR